MSNLHQLLLRNLNLKLDHHTGGKRFIHGPKHRKENQLLNLITMGFHRMIKPPRAAYQFAINQYLLNKQEGRPQ